MDLIYFCDLTVIRKYFNNGIKIYDVEPNWKSHAHIPGWNILCELTWRFFTGAPEWRNNFMMCAEDFL